MSTAARFMTEAQTYIRQLEHVLSEMAVHVDEYERRLDRAIEPAIVINHDEPITGAIDVNEEAR